MLLTGMRHTVPLEYAKFKLPCVASVSVAFSALNAKADFRISDAREMGRGSKTKMRGGSGGGAKETLARKPHDSAERRSPTNAEL